MTIRLHTVVLLAALAVFPMSSLGQSQSPSSIVATPVHLVDHHYENLARNTKLIFIDGRPDSLQRKAVTDSMAMEMLAFYYDQFRHYEDPAAPYFLFMSRDAQLSMGLGGVVRMRGYYDLDGAVPASAFSPYLIPVPHVPGDKRQFGTTPSGTCLYFTVMGRTRKTAQDRYMLYIEANFNGYKGRDFHLKKAYAQWREFTLGLAPSTFGDVAAQTPTVDANGPSNKIAPGNVLLRYMPVVRNKWVFAVSVEDPSSPAQYDLSDTACAKVRKWLPDFAAFVQYQWRRNEHVRLSGMYRMMTYRDRLASRNVNVSGWGMMASAVARPMYRMTLYGSYVIGRGFTSNMNDLLMGNYDLIPHPGRPGRMYSPLASGWHLGAQWNFTPELFVTVSAGQTRYSPDHGAPGDEYRRGTLVMANAFWNPAPRAMFGIEYAWGRRCNRDGSRADAQRIGAVAQFSF